MFAFAALTWNIWFFQEKKKEDDEKWREERRWETTKRDDEKREAKNRRNEEKEQKRKDREEAILWELWSVAVERYLDVPLVDWCRYCKKGKKVTGVPIGPFPTYITDTNIT